MWKGYKSMSEIEKIYKLAGVNKRCHANIKFDDCIYSPSDCGNYNYPPFTAEKQLELIKWLKDNRNFHTCGNWCTTLDSTGITVEHRDKKFEQALAGLINQLFIAHDLTEEQQQQLKEILE